MDTLVAFLHHEDHDQFYGRNGGHCLKPGGNLPAQSKAYPMTSPIIRRAFSSFSPKTPSSSASQKAKNLKWTEKSCPIPVPSEAKFAKKGSLLDDFCFSERWAGPAYSNSPPPSSLPIPKFSIQPKRSVSLDMATSTNELDIRIVAKSAPSSPVRIGSFHRNCNFNGDPFTSSDSATKTLRRILNLDSVDG